jgi:hypothetical protein
MRKPLERDGFRAHPARLRFMNQSHVAMSNAATLPKGAPRRALGRDTSALPLT